MDGSSNVVSSSDVNGTTGAYSLINAVSGTAYTVRISNTAGVLPGAAAPAASLPTGWVNTGVNLAGVANTANQTGIISVTPTGNVANQNFAVEQPPTAGSGSNSAVNPNGTVQVTVPANTFTSIANSTDPTASPLGVTGIRLTAFPTGATSVVINGITYNSGTPANVTALLALNIPTDANGNPTVTITADPAATGATSVVFTFRARDAAGQLSTNTGTATLNLGLPSVTLQVKVLLQGAVLGNEPGLETTMRDNLRSSTYASVLGTRYIPDADPYTLNSDYSDLFTKVGDGTNPDYQTVISPSTMFADRSGTSTSAVDWVFIELRDKNNSSTILGTRSAIVQQDGTVVDIDGSSCIRFPSLLNDDYYVAIRHRNHLGAMTALPKPATTFNCSSVVDFTTMTDAQVWHDPATPQYDGLEMALVTNTMTNTTYKALWAGNANTDNKVKYQGGTNDRTLIQSDVINFPSNVSLNINYDLAFGYFKGDINLDSKAKYQGAANDRTILQSLVLGYLLNSTLNINYDLFLQQLP